MEGVFLVVGTLVLIAAAVVGMRLYDRYQDEQQNK